MAAYAKTVGRRSRQMTGDIAALIWTIAWGIVGMSAYKLVMAIAGPVQEVADSSHAVSSKFQSSAENVGKVPLVGGSLNDPLTAMATAMNNLGDTAQRQIEFIHRVALITGWVTFLGPVLTLLAVWIPIRLYFMRQSAATKAVLHSSGDLQLFALRALTNQPMTVLRKISPDPAGAWAAGDPVVIRKLADIELRRAGVKTPSDVRASGAPAIGR